MSGMTAGYRRQIQSFLAGGKRELVFAFQIRLSKLTALFNA